MKSEKKKKVHYYIKIGQYFHKFSTHILLTEWGSVISSVYKCLSLRFKIVETNFKNIFKNTWRVFDKTEVN